MKVYRSLTELSALHGSVAWAMGMFDGVHIGHAAVIDTAVRHAKQHGAVSAVLTFEQHPSALLAPQEQPPAIVSSQTRKLTLLHQLGVQTVLILPFSAELAAMTPQAFIGELCTHCNVACIAVGADYRFGKNRAGDIQTLQQLGRQYGFIVHAVQEVHHLQQRVSSTRIRRLVAQAQFEQIHSLLGRPFTWQGTVIEGRRLARQLQFSTANMRPEQHIQPPHGVYAVRCKVNDTVYQGVANFGVRPTVEQAEGELLLETHLFDFDGDLYGLHLIVEPIKRLREERRFDSLESLRQQIAQDVKSAQKVLKCEIEPIKTLQKADEA